MDCFVFALLAFYAILFDEVDCVEFLLLGDVHETANKLASLVFLTFKEFQEFFYKYITNSQPTHLPVSCFINI
jgi:hypothetical protein